MDFRHLQQFLVLADTLNFHRAAEKLHMSQPPLSVSIRKLEESVGVPLFVRGRQGVQLTEAGLAALDEARRALFHAEQFRLAARAGAAGEGGTVRVGFVGSATHAILPRVLPLFRQRYPGVTVVLREATSIRIMQDLADDALEVGIVRVPVAMGSNVRLSPLTTEHFVLAVPRGHALARRGRLRLADLADEAFIMYTATEAAGLRMAAINACQLRGFTPRITQEAVQVQTLLSLVESGLGVALVPAGARRHPSPNVVTKTLSDFPADASIGISLAWNPATERSAARNLRELAGHAFRPRPVK
ncbi:MULTISPECIES: LysR family transcriptional regulator [Achromobacter]|uniref:LysR family transcriptional regulator n=1 Tax=Achromobacter spanius TaxID=217203 RepID=A0AAW3I0B3_9BURK|nr:MULTISPECIES: LysR family transcriptional regulator [Achromobacter]AZS80515.1 LysR family transcriptional regulator [Achromobacter spanius]KNE26120.1 LysR family transcriptional regulator [Achromobacter spanius]MCD0498802.1 LysR family transcriptional regulator [Achromobacter sp. MY14]MCW3152122.1 LysR family transcriptional regulator [Achromobacter spanius]